MDLANGLTFRLKQILSKLKLLNVVRSYTLKIDYGRIGDDLKDCLLEINALLRKCVKKIRSKPRRAEIRNVIGELVRKKNTKRIKDVQPNSDVTIVSETEGIKYQQFESEKRYLCEFCGVKFIHYTNLKVHVVKVHESSGTLKSKESKHVTSRNESEGRLHSDNVTGTSDLSHPEFPCIKYNPSFQNSENPSAAVTTGEVSCRISDLIRDEDKRTERGTVESYPCPQSGCQRIFHKQGSLKKHIRLKHSTIVRHCCSKCDKEFFEKGKLNRHLLTHRLGQFQCSKCHRTFHRKDNLKRHIALHYENVNAFACRFCEKKFSLKFNRDTHEANVHTNADIQCESCGKKFKNEATLRVHKRLHEENRISCSLCCRKFTRKAHYRNHLKSKHKGVSPFQMLFDSFAVLGSNSPT